MFLDDNKTVIMLQLGYYDHYYVVFNGDNKVAGRDDSNRVNIGRAREFRKYYFYIDWLRSVKGVESSGINFQDIESCKRAVNKIINHHFPDKEQQSDLQAEMDAACEENILPIEVFDWLKQDERAAFWLWGYICKIGDSQLGIPPQGDATHSQNWYQRLQLSESPANHQERMNTIFHFFDSIIIPTPPVSHLKHQVIDRLKMWWKDIYNRPMPLKWLPDEEEPVLWAWNNLQKVQQERIGSPYSNVFKPTLPGLTTWFAPLSHSERHHALRAALDLWEDSPDSKKLFLLNLNKAWNQHKLRQSRTDKKALNTYLKNETKMRLDLLATHHGMRISDVLEKLINEHYRKALAKE